MWPSLPFASRRSSDASPFSPSVEWPTLRVVVDPDAEIPSDVSRYLELLRRGDSKVRLLRRVQEGELVDTGDYEVIPPGPETGGEYGGVRERRKDGVALIGIPSARNNIAAAYNWAQHYGFDPDEAQARQLDAEAALSLDADVYLTDNAFLLRQPRPMAAASVAETLAVIGLHQRVRSRVILGEGFGGVLGTWQVEMIQARALLPESARAFTATGAPLPSGAVRLVGAACQRLGRALRARDQLLLSSVQRVRSFGVDDPDDAVERVAIALQGMFDALARALNESLGGPLPVGSVGFHQKTFLKSIPESSRQVASDPRVRALRGVIAELRNTVHHEPVGRAASEVRGRLEELVTLPRTSAERFLLNADELGHRERWVAFDVEQTGLALRPIALCDDIITEAATSANRLLASFPWSEPADDSGEADDSNWLENAEYLAMNQHLYGL